MLLMAKKIGDIDVETSSHNSKYHKRVVVCHDLLNCTEEEIARELAPQGERLPASTSEKVRAAIHRLNVRPFIPKSMQCL